MHTIEYGDLAKW